MHRFITNLIVAAGLMLYAGAAFCEAGISLGQGMMAGEVTRSRVILHARLTQGEVLVDGDMPGAPGIGRFEISTDPAFTRYRKTAWLYAHPDTDYILKAHVANLKSGTRYYYRLRYGPSREVTTFGPMGTFRTHAKRRVAEPVRFVVVTGMNYGKFYDGGNQYSGADKALGYPALEAILQQKPDFFVGTGDNVYYDWPKSPAVRTQAELRRKWHEQFAQPRFKALFAQVPTYWEKDDHDFRFNDCDLTGDTLPLSALGIDTFREQVPVAPPGDARAVTYRTYRVNQLLQLWFVEGRDYRDANTMPDGPSKTLWGREQLNWLKRTLRRSDATFKILVSPTPLIGPDDEYKEDNHTNPGGFQYERDIFFAWLKKHRLEQKNFFIVCGDRHWQYHSIHPDGLEEFSCGALVDANARRGRLSLDPKGTDPDGLIAQPYVQTEPSGGFLQIEVMPAKARDGASIVFTHFDETGAKLYRVTH